MVNCVECGRKLGFLKGYRHPTMGRKYLLCNNCFDNVDESVTQWREFLLPYAELIKPPILKKSRQLNFNYYQNRVPYGCKTLD